MAEPQQQTGEARVVDLMDALVESVARAKLERLARRGAGDCIHEPLLGTQTWECSTCIARRTLREMDRRV